MASVENFVQSGKKCIGIAANYYSFLKAKNKTKPDVPIIFLKPTSSYITEGEKIIIPKGFTIVNEEIELGVVIGKKCKHVPEDEAMDYVGGYCAALDMSAMCQIKPDASWTLCKGFDTACPVSKFIPKEKILDPHNVNLWLKVNGKEWQRETTGGLVFKIPYLISYLSRFFTLEPGDLIVTGSPAGVGAVQKGDVIEAGIEGIVSFRFEVDAE
ncbi:oxaloacetate decarboxylase, mitochondrial-like [Euwallacea fornicatus]|uniref:oxaloacetate decarboxylase, mitochondrial-like n=1 Tax=Euwallacea fornicatus TaxID=995702 RepID=UPI00338F979E